MRFSDVKYRIPRWMNSLDQNSYVTRGFALRSFGIDLERIPDSMMLSCAYVPADKSKTYKELKKVYVRDILGTSYQDYGGDTWMACFLKAKRMDYYILNGDVTKAKYLRELKRIPQYSPIELTLTPQGLVIDGNGNHRVSAYMMMYLSEMCAKEYNEKDMSPEERRSFAFDNYWLYAVVNIPVNSSPSELINKYGCKVTPNWIKMVCQT